MKLLLDTHLLLWAAAGNLPADAARYINDMDNILYFSPASIWEIVIKCSLDRTDFIVDPASLYDGLIRAGYIELAIKGQHTLFVHSLPMLHKDPFDRILLAQSAYERITLLTSDELISQYPGYIIYIQ